MNFSRSRKHPIALLSAALICLSPLVSAFAAPRFEGKVSWKFRDDKAAIKLAIGKIANNSENSTGTLKVQLWASATPYTGGTIRGFKCASSGKIKGLGPNQFYKNFKRISVYTPPSKPGKFSLTLVLLEYQAEGYVIVDHFGMPGRTALRPAALFEMVGPWKWQTNQTEGTVAVSVAKIRHNRKGRTGTLQVSLWATPSPYRGGTLSGYKLGSTQKNPLEKGFSYTQLNSVMDFTPPPAGIYYVTLILSESNGKAFEVVDYLPSSSTTKFEPLN